MDSDNKKQNSGKFIDFISLDDQDQEKYDEVICDELKLKEWTFFEHYEDISTGVKTGE